MAALLRRIMDSDLKDPVNLGSNELVTIDQLVDLAEDLGGVRLKRLYEPDSAKGVNGRNSDNTLILGKLGWEPSIKLKEGLPGTYLWIERRYLERSKRTS